MDPEPSVLSRSVPGNPNKKAKLRSNVQGNGILVYYSAFSGPPSHDTWIQLGERPGGFPKAEFVFTPDEMRGTNLEARFSLDFFRPYLFENHF